VGILLGDAIMHAIHARWQLCPATDPCCVVAGDVVLDETVSLQNICNIAIFQCHGSKRLEKLPRAWYWLC
jgi:hypothetical protein